MGAHTNISVKSISVSKQRACKYSVEYLNCLGVYEGLHRQLLKVQSLDSQVLSLSNFGNPEFS